ncbi:MAG: D-alanine--D-alanine ligase [Armatimonadota bacterium]|nr:D-alanine--D-alanine ligase [Armatimonadota bacterium]MDR7426692.1 D-alanine--D-alanine ligase [Armatimonadota bacterium]MDR7469243.1 D-alanine--D-alanine ligase [Armatimonadota bacterium]MDR7475046.1 D-alanine--D-alanine ligase [Armatimonadota bacterium]MDR7538956.1 D-alanine--D-alanine ligase [Armatimonadota bacterium]
MSRLRVAVLMGGPSPEREVSLHTGRQILAALDPARYQAVPVEVLPDGRWALGGGPPPVLSGGEAPQGGRLAVRSGAIGIDRVLQDGPLDVVLVAMHGPYGEDGTVQGLLELAGLPYTGSGVLASALAMDKLRSRQLFAFNHIPVPATVVVTRAGMAREWTHIAGEVSKTLGYPCVVKPNALGSSIGVAVVRDPEGLRPACEAALAYGDVVLVEEYIRGTEITGAVLEDPATGQAQALPLVEIVPRREFFTYEAKYTPGASEEICPARLPLAVGERAQELAVRAHQVLGCRDMSRVDMFVRDGRVLVLEVNTIPGMTAVSLLPLAARTAGIEFHALLDRLIACALRRRG